VSKGDVNPVVSRSSAYQQVKTWLALTLTVGVIALSGTASAQDLNIIRIGTGSTAGTYFPIGGLIGNAISNPPGSRPCERGGSCGVPGLIAVAQSTGGSLDNIRSVEAGLMEMGLSQADVAYWSYFGTGSFEGNKPRDTLRALANLFPENIHLIARADAGIETLMDLKGKRVSLGGPGSGSQIDARLIMNAFGLRFSDIKIQNLGLEPSVAALVAGDIDAFFLVTGAPALAIQDLAERVPLTSPTLDVGAILLGRADMADDLAYGIVRAIWHPNTAPLLANGHPRAKLMALSRAAKGIGFTLHPGARRYYVEQGILPDLTLTQVDVPDSVEAPR